MTTADIKNSIHSMIDNIDNRDMLDAFYMSLKNNAFRKQGSLIGALSDVEKKELYDSWDESQDDDKLIDNEEVREKYKKWL